MNNIETNPIVEGYIIVDDTYIPISIVKVGNSTITVRPIRGGEHKIFNLEQDRWGTKNYRRPDKTSDHLYARGASNWSRYKIRLSLDVEGTKAQADAAMERQKKKVRFKKAAEIIKALIEKNNYNDYMDEDIIIVLETAAQSILNLQTKT